jgi:hypothetical protein
MQTQAARQPLPADHVARIHQLIEATLPGGRKRGLAGTAKLLGIAINTLDRARGGLPMQPGTRSLIKDALAGRGQEGKNS